MQTAVVSVIGMGSVASPVSLLDGVELRTGTEAELVQYFGTEGDLPIGHTAWFENVLAIVPAQSRTAYEVLNDLEIALQSAVDAPIGFGASRHGDGVVTGGDRPINVGLFVEGPLAAWHGCPAPAPADVAAAAELWSTLPTRTDETTALRIRRGMRRYRRALEEHDDEAIFHLVAACEAVTSPEHAQKGQHSRFVKRVSKTVTERPNQRAKAEEHLEVFWKRRSGFAHGDQIPLPAEINIMRSYTHRVIASALREPERFTWDQCKNLG